MADYRQPLLGLDIPEESKEFSVEIARNRGIFEGEVILPFDLLSVGPATHIDPSQERANLKE